ncbi:MAG: hypothetical protein AB1861_08375 [Cyanobacteriota bacterium]
MQALSEGKLLERESAHRRELPTALNTSIYANSQKTKPPYYAPLDFCFFQAPDQGRIPSPVCDCFLALHREELLPAWSLEVAPVDELQKNTRGEKFEGVRVWMTKGLILLLPSREGQLVHIGMVLAGEECPSGKVTLWDTDSSVSHQVIVPKGVTGASFDVKWMVVT